MAEERTLGQLVSDATKDVSELIRYEVALAKAEIRSDVKRGAVAGGMFGAAAFMGLLAVVPLLIAAGLGLAYLVPTWLAFLLEGVFLLLVAGALALVGRSQIGGIKPPERTIRTTKQTIATLQRKGGANGAATATPDTGSS